MDANEFVRLINTLTPEAARLFASDCAEHVLSNYEATYPSDERPREAIKAARAYARGEISRDELAAAAALAAACAEADLAEHGAEEVAAEAAAEVDLAEHRASEDALAEHRAAAGAARDALAVDEAARDAAGLAGLVAGDEAATKAATTASTLAATKAADEAFALAPLVDGFAFAAAGAATAAEREWQVGRLRQIIDAAGAAEDDIESPP